MTRSANMLLAMKAMAEVGPSRTDADWYLQEWMALRGLTQTRISQLTGWSVGKVNEIYHGTTPYKRDTLNVLAGILEIEPYELLMHPTLSSWYRQFAEVARSRPAEIEGR